MGTVYIDMGGSRIASHDGVAQSASDNASIAGWYRDSDIMFCHTIYTSKGPLTRQFKLQYRNVTDSGAWTDIGDGTGEIRYDDVDTVIPSDDFTLTSGYRICSIVSGYTWQNGVGNVGDNLILSTGGYTINDEYYTEFQWALGVGYTTLSKTYEFRAYDITMSYAHAAFGAQLTINSSDIEATGSRLWGESTLGSPTYRYDWSEWRNNTTWTLVTPVNGNYGQLNEADVVSPVFRFGGAKFTKIIENLYGSLGSGTPKLYIRAYPSIFPYNASSGVVLWTELDRSTISNPYGMLSTSDGFYKYAQLRVVDSTSSSSSTNIILSAAGRIAGDSSTILIRATDKTGWAAGREFSSGQLGTGLVSNTTFRSVAFPAGKSWSTCSAGSSNSAWIDTNGFLWVGGNNASGQLGQNNTIAVSTGLVSVLGGHVFSKVNVGGAYVAAIKPDGSVWTWGHRFSIGNGDTTRSTDVLSPVSVVGGHSFIDHIFSSYMSYALKSDGTVWAWGDAITYDSFGSGIAYNKVGYVSYSVSPIKISADLSVSRFYPTYYNGCYLEVPYGADSGVYLIGAGASQDPVVGALRPATPEYLWGDIALVRRYTTIAWATAAPAWAGLTENGQIFTWGNNRQGVLGRLQPYTVTPGGLGNLKMTSYHSPVWGGLSWKAIFGGNACHFAAVTSQGNIWGWGENVSSNLANVSTIFARYPRSARGGNPWE